MHTSKTPTGRDTGAPHPHIWTSVYAPGHVWSICIFGLFAFLVHLHIWFLPAGLLAWVPACRPGCLSVCLSAMHTRLQDHWKINIQNM